MNIGIYQSAAALSSLERWQDAVSKNMTSSQVNGYKRNTVQVSAKASGEVLPNVGARPDRGEGMPAMFPQSKYGISFVAGEQNPTRRDLDLAIVGDGFFTVKKPDGSLGYTRDGELNIRSDRTVVTGQGMEIMTEDKSPLVVTASGGSLLITADGTVRQGDKVLGKLAISKPSNESFMIPGKGGLFIAKEGADMQTVEKPIIQQGYLEASNVSPLREMVDMVNLSRAYESNQKMIQSRDALMGKTLDALT